MKNDHCLVTVVMSKRKNFLCLVAQSQSESVSSLKEVPFLYCKPDFVSDFFPMCKSFSPPLSTFHACLLVSSSKLSSCSMHRSVNRWRMCSNVYRMSGTEWASQISFTAYMISSSNFSQWQSGSSEKASKYEVSEWRCLEINPEMSVASNTAAFFQLCSPSVFVYKFPPDFLPKNFSFQPT